MADPIDFYFDFSSPYGYFAAFKIDEIGETHGREVVWHPIMLGPAFKASGNAPLIDQPLKGAYSKHDWERLARYMQVPWTFPEPFPVATLAAARAFYWLEGTDKALARRFAHAVFRTYFGEGRTIQPPDTVAEIGAEMGIGRADLLAAIQAPEWKQRLKDETDAAIARGVFGSPFIFVDGEGFWGADRLWMVRHWLARGGW